MKFKKKLMIKSLGILFVSSLVATPIIACGSKDNTSSNIDSNKPSDGNQNGNNNSNSGSQNTGDSSSNNTVNNPSIVSPNVSNSSKMEGNYQSESSYKNGLKQNVSDFVQNADFSKYTGDESGLNQDILLYFLNLSKEYNNLTITNPQISQITINNDKLNSLSTNSVKKAAINTISTSQELVLNASSVSFNVLTTISSKIKQTINLGAKPFTLEDGKSYTLKIAVNNQMLEPAINNYLSENYLSWKVADADFSIDNNTWKQNDFAFNNNFFSHVFKYKFDNLLNGYTYFDLKNQNESKAYDISDDNLQNYVSNKIDNSLDTYIKYVDYSTDILNVLKQNLPIDEMLKKLAPSVIDLMTDANLIPSSLKNFLIESIYGKSDSTGKVSDVPLVTALKDNSKELSEFIAGLIGGSEWEPTIESFLSQIGPNMTKETIEEFKALLKGFGIDDSLITIIANDVFGENGKAKSLIDILFDNYPTIFAQIKKFLPSVPYLDAIQSLLGILLNKSNGKYQSIYDSVFSSKENKQKFFDALKKLVSFSPEVEKIINILIINNDSFEKDNLIAFVTSLSDFMNGFFAKNDHYTSLSDKYKNLTFTKTIKQKATLDKNKKTISFDYEYNFSLKSEVTLNLESFKDLFSGSSVLDLVQEIAKEYGVTISLPTNTFLKTLVGGAVKGLIFGFLPNKIVFGKNSDQSTKKSNPNNLTFKFTANNNPTWFEPIKNGNNYNAGFGFAYNMNIYHDDPSMYDSITSVYQPSAETINIPTLVKIQTEYSNFLRSVISNILARDYDVSLQMDVDSNTKIADTSNYDESQIYSSYSFENNVNLAGNGDFIINTLPMNNSSYFKDVSSLINKDKTYLWNSKNKDDEKLLGKKPIIPSDKISTIKNRLFKFSDSTKNITSLSIIPTFNMDLPFHMIINGSSINKTVNIDLKIMLTTVDLYFPFKVMDTKTNTLVNSIHKNITYFKIVSDIK